MHERMDGRMERISERRRDGWVMDGWMDGYIDVDGEMYAWIQMEGGGVDRYMFGYRWMGGWR